MTKEEILNMTPEQHLDSAIKFSEQEMKRDAKKRKQQWDEEQGETDGVVVFIIALAVGILIGDFVLRFIY